MDPLTFNITVAWAAALAGMLSGAVMGLGFRREDWLGGYGSLRRRMLRLGHVACFGLAFLNLAFVVTIREAGPFELQSVAGVLFALSAAMMPLACFAGAWRRGLIALTGAPALAMVVACILTLIGALT